MLKSKLLVPVVLCAVVVLTTANGYGPQRGNSAKSSPADTDAVSSRANVEAGIVFVPAKVRKRRPRFTNVAMNATPEKRRMLEMMSKPVPALDIELYVEIRQGSRPGRWRFTFDSLARPC